MSGPEPGNGDETIKRMSLRSGGWIGYNDEFVFVRRTDNRDLKFRLEDLMEVQLRMAEWDLVVMSLLLIGVGGYVGLTRSTLVGIGFAAVGCWSFYRTYANRHQLILQVRNEPKPISIHPAHPKACHQTLGALIRSDADPNAEVDVVQADGSRG